MDLRTLACPGCGGPLPRHARWTAVICRYCGASVTPGVSLVARKDFRRALADSEREQAAGAADVSVAGVRWRTLGLLARGEISDVFLATRARRLTERVLVKVLRAPEDADLFAREWEVLDALQAGDAQGAAHFALRVPSPVVHGEACFADGRSARAIIVRAAAGFRHTLDDVRDAYPGGVDARHAVWIWRRILELLGWVHRNGWVHAAVLPQHVVLHTGDHGAILVGWSCAVRTGEKVTAVSVAHERFYPSEVLDRAPATTALDLTMSARSVLYALGANDRGELHRGVPSSVRELLETCASGEAVTDDAWLLKDLVAEAAQRAFGPPAFVPLEIRPRGA